MQRPHPAQASASPAHRFGPGEGAYDLGHDLGHDLRRWPSRALDQRDIKVAFLVRARLGLVEGAKPGGFEESLKGRVWRADPGAFLLLAHIGRALRQAIDHHGEPARRGEAADRLEAEPRRLQCIAEQMRQILRRARLHPRGDLLREQLQQQLSHARTGFCQAWAPPASVFSQAAQHALASSRTRKMKPCRSVTEITPRASSRLKRCEALIA